MKSRVKPHPKTRRKRARLRSRATPASKRRKAASARDARLKRAYGISSKERDKILARQGGGCKICHHKRNKKGEPLLLHVDHDHKAIHSKRTTKKKDGKWYCYAKYKDHKYKARGRTKSEVVQNVKAQLKRAAVRGIICWPCNRALRVFCDNPKKLRAAAKYLEQFDKGKHIARKR